MAGRRVVVFGVGAAIAALVLSACGTSPSLPPPVVVTSPYYGSSTAIIDPLSGIGRQGASVRVCSLTGGPLAVDVHSPAADADTQLSVGVVSTDAESTGDVVGATLIGQTFPEPTTPVDVHLESNRPLRAGECADVRINSSRNLFEAGGAFSFAVTW